VHRGHHHGRVPQVRGEGCALERRFQAIHVGPSVDETSGSCGDQGPLRDTPSGPDHGRGGGGGRTAVAAVYRGSVPADKALTSSTRPGPRPPEGHDAPLRTPRDGKRGGAPPDPKGRRHPHAGVRGGGSAPRHRTEAPRELEERKGEWKEQRSKLRQRSRRRTWPTWWQVDRIPLQQLEEAESAKLLRMEAELARRVVGQEEAIKAVSRAIRRSRAGVKNPNRPVGSFIFLGPPAWARPSWPRLCRVPLWHRGRPRPGGHVGVYGAVLDLAADRARRDTSGTTTRGSSPRRFGGGRFPWSCWTRSRKPIRKSSICFFKSRDGRLTDSYGRVVDFRNTILIMTSNVGTRQFTLHANLGFAKSGMRRTRTTRCGNGPERAEARLQSGAAEPD